MTQTIRELTGKDTETILTAAAESGYSKEFIRTIIGTGEKKLAQAEKNNYGKTNRSIHYMQDLAAGTVLTKENIALLRTEKNLTAGESPEFFNRFIGAVLQRPVTGGAGAVFEDIVRNVSL